MCRVNLSAVCLLLIAVSAQAADSIAWQSDYAKAAELAARERKLLMLHFYSDDCAPCRKLDANVFPRPEVAAAINAAYIPVKINVERSPELARKFQIVKWPTDVFTTPNALEVYRAVPEQDPTRYAAMLSAVAARSGSALARKTTVPTGKPVAHQQPVDNTSEFQPEGTNPTSTAKSPANAARPQTNPYMPSTAAKSAPANATSARSDSEFIPEGGLPTPPKFGPTPQESNPAAKTENKSNPARPQENPHVPAPVLPAPEKKAGLPPVGMDGYCVITLAEKHVWTKGDKRYGAIHRGRLYLFANSEAQKTFLADPDRFSPALSGCDPVLFAETGKLIDGQRAHGLAYNGQTYLFADEASLRKFESSPAPFAETVYQALLKSDSAAKLR